MSDSNRTIVNDRTPTFVLPTMRHGVPIAKTGKGRQPKPLNPALVAMQPGQSFIVTGEATVKAMIGDIGRIRKARTDVEFVTRNLGGKADPETFETYPPFALGVWCVEVKKTEGAE